MQPLVQATVTAGAPSGTGAWPTATMPAPGVVPVYGPVTKRSTSGSGRLRAGAWLLASLAGTAVGFALSSSVITLLR
jgi:hypothetical protein